MKKVARLTTLLLLGSTAAATILAAGDKAFQKTAQPVTVTIGKEDDTAVWPKGETAQDNRVTRYIQNRVNVDVNYSFIASGDTYTRRIELATASNSLPDGMIVNRQQLQNLARANLLTDLTPLYASYVSPYIQKAIQAKGNRSFGVVNGKQLAIPQVEPDGNELNLVWVRKDWLDKLGLPVPRTMADFNRVAEAFTTKDPDGNGKNDTYAIAANMDWLFSFRPFFAAYGAYPGAWVRDGQGQVVYGTTMPGMKNALTTLQDWAKKRYIDPNFFSLNWDQKGEKIASGKYGMFVGPWWAGGIASGTLANDKKVRWVSLTAPVGPDGRYGSVNAIPQRYLVVSKKAKDPAAVLKVMNTEVEGINADKPSFADMKEPLGWTQAWPFMLQITQPDEYVRSHNRIVQAVKTGKTTALTSTDKPIYELLKQGQKNPTASGDVYGTVLAQGGLEALNDKRVRQVFEVAEGVDAVSKDRFWPTLKKQEDQTILGIIAGTLPVSAYDTFVKQWGAQGGDRITAAVRQAAGK